MSQIYMKINIHHTTVKGFSLVELIVYIGLLSLLTVTLTSTVISLFTTKEHLEAREEIAYSSTISLERMTREIRKAKSVATGVSTLGSHPSTLTLNTTDSSGDPTTVTINLISGRIFLKEGANAAYPLSENSVTVSDFVVTRYVTTNTEGIAIEITAQKNVQGTVIQNVFRTFVVLDGS